MSLSAEALESLDGTAKIITKWLHAHVESEKNPAECLGRVIDDLNCDGGQSIIGTALRTVMRTDAGGFLPADVSGRADSLSQRENEVLQCIARGETNKDIANSLNIETETAKVHVKTVLRKLGCRNRTEAAVWAVKHLSAANFGN